jgi:hypothetical protein
LTHRTNLADWIANQIQHAQKQLTTDYSSSSPGVLFFGTVQKAQETMHSSGSNNNDNNPASTKIRSWLNNISQTADDPNGGGNKDATCALVYRLFNVTKDNTAADDFCVYSPSAPPPSNYRQNDWVDW